jgi:hypothetical protein
VGKKMERLWVLQRVKSSLRVRKAYPKPEMMSPLEEEIMHIASKKGKPLKRKGWRKVIIPRARKVVDEWIKALEEQRVEPGRKGR